MAHKTLIGGTAYNVSGGRSMVNGTVYNISGGRALVSGTGYNISFDGGLSGNAYAHLYSDGDFVFKRNNDVETGKTLVASYTGFENASYTSNGSVPWDSKSSNITNIYCNEEIAPVSLSYWFYNYRNTTFNVVNFNLNNVTNMAYTHSYCHNLTGSPVCGEKVTNMAYAYENCSKMTGSPVCGDNVTNMAGTYDDCSNLTGSPVCGNNVTNMYYTYYNCRKITGSPVCGNKVTDMTRTYYYCYNITGSPVCGDNVTNMAYTYVNCNITGSPVCGNKVTNMRSTYQNCLNLTGNGYFYSNNVNSVINCFRGKNNSRRLNLYVPANSTTNTTVHYNKTTSLVGANIKWTNAGKYQYNTAYNIYIYPVANVAAARAANRD